MHLLEVLNLLGMRLSGMMGLPKVGDRDDPALVVEDNERTAPT